jgi:CBS-domain-containing membrane protein
MAFCKEVSDCCTQMSSIISYRKVLLVGKDKEKSVAQLILVEHALKFLTSLDNTVSVVGVDNKDDTLGILKVMSPERSDLVLTTNVPNCELDVLVLDGLNVEAYRRGQ